MRKYKFAGVVATLALCALSSSTAWGDQRPGAAAGFTGDISRGVPTTSTPVERELHLFRGSNDGTYPLGDLLADKAGALYGTTADGGAYQFGAMFKLTPSRTGYTESILYNFKGSPDGETPSAGLIADKNGALYGTTTYGGSFPGCVVSGGACGTVFRLAPAGTGYTETVLYSFGSYLVDGEFPEGALIADKGGALFGTTVNGGVNFAGAVFEVTPSPSGYTERILHNFDGTSGAAPVAGLIADASGALYGTTRGGAQCGYGDVFKLTRSGQRYTAHVLHNFCGEDGAMPEAALISDATGDLYGTTISGGTGEANCHVSCGVVFRLTPAAAGYSYAVLHNFRGGRDGAAPTADLAAGPAGALFGTTGYGGGSRCNSVGCGTTFSLMPAGSKYSERILYRFKGGADGRNPAAGLVIGVKGLLYGTTPLGGVTGQKCSYGCGTVFTISP